MSVYVGEGGSSEDFWPMVEWCAGYLCLDECIFWVLMDRLQEKAPRGVSMQRLVAQVGWELRERVMGTKVDSSDHSKKRPCVSHVRGWGNFHSIYGRPTKGEGRSNRSALNAEIRIHG